MWVAHSTIDVQLAATQRKMRFTLKVMAMPAAYSSVVPAPAERSTAMSSESTDEKESSEKYVVRTYDTAPVALSGCTQ